MVRVAPSKRKPLTASSHLRRVRGARFARLPLLVTGLLVASWSVVPGPISVKAAAASGTALSRATANSSRAKIVWSPCPAQAGYQCGRVTVPLNYSDPNAGTVSLPLIRRPVRGGRISSGALFLNPGGPGESAVDILPVLAGLLPPQVSDHFDLVSFDERGTGTAGPLECGPSPAQVSATPPVPARVGGALPVATTFLGMAQGCARRYPTLISSVDSTDAARDMDRIRADMGLARVSYYGLSYGTVLGAIYAHLFPRRVRRMVLDGAVDVTEGLLVQARQEAPAIQASLDHMLSSCAAQPDCPLGRNPAGFYARLEGSLSRAPLPAPGNGDPVPVTVGDLDTATLFTLTLPPTTSGLEAALVAASRGDGAPLRALALQFQEDVDGTSLVGPLWTITCHDAASRPTPRAAGALASQLSRRYSLAAAYAVPYNTGACLRWPWSDTAITSVHAPVAAPIMIIGNTGDPNTPHIAAQLLAQQLGTQGRLVTWRGWGHTWILNGHENRCMDRLVVLQLVDSRAPANGSVC